MKKMIPLLFAISSVSFAAQWGVYLGNHQGQEAIVTNDLFLPVVDKKDFVTFIDLRQAVNPDSSNVVHLGLGVRKEFKNNIILGANTSYANSSIDGQNYGRMSYGLEVLSPFIDWRINFYTGLNEHRIGTSEDVSAYLDDQGQIKLQIDQHDQYRAAFNGIDMMIGNEFELKNGLNLGVHAGAYSFFKDGYDPIYGGQVELSLSKDFNLKANNVSGSFGFDGAYRYDNVNGGRINAGIGARFSFGPNHKKQSRDLLSEVRRQDDVIVGERMEHSSRVTDGIVDIGAYEYTEVAMLQNSDDFISTIEGAAPNTLVMLDGDSGNYLLDSDVLTTNDGQALVGGGTSLLVTDNEGRQAILVLPGSNASIISSGNGKLVLGTDSVLINIDYHHLKSIITDEGNKIINGSFEEGHGLHCNQWGVYSEVYGWLADLEAVDAPIEIQQGSVGGVLASDGYSKLELDSHDKNGFTQSNAHVYQDVETTEGETYRLTLDYSARVNGDDNTNGVAVYVDGELVETLNSDSTGWETKEILFNATSDVTRVEFRALGDEDTLGGYIDNVKMEHVNF